MPHAVMLMPCHPPGLGLLILYCRNRVLHRALRSPYVFWYIFTSLKGLTVCQAKQAALKCDDCDITEALFTSKSEEYGHLRDTSNGPLCLSDSLLQQPIQHSREESIKPHNTSLGIGLTFANIWPHVLSNGFCQSHSMRLGQQY